MARKRAPKAKTMKILDEATMTYCTVHLHRVDFTSGNVVEVYGPDAAGALTAVRRLYENKGAFGVAISAVLAQ